MPGKKTGVIPSLKCRICTALFFCNVDKFVTIKLIVTLTTYKSMNTFITFLIILVAFILVILIVALFLKKEYSVIGEIIIDKPKEEVFGYIRYLKNQEYYSKWVMTDPKMQKIYKGTDGAIGFIYGWNGNKKAGEGEQEIIRLKEDEMLETEIRFKRPFAGIAYASFTIAAVAENKTGVTWRMSSAMSYPMNIMLLFNIEKMLSNDIQTSLLSLKHNLEK